MIFIVQTIEARTFLAYPNHFLTILCIYGCEQYSPSQTKLLAKQYWYNIVLFAYISPNLGNVEMKYFPNS